MNGYRLTSPADADLESIWQHIAKDNIDAADRLIDAINDVFAALARQPRIGRSCDAMDTGLFRFPAINYVVFYRIEHRLVVIVRVIHSARDVDALFQIDES